MPIRPIKDNLGKYLANRNEYDRLVSSGDLSLEALEKSIKTYNSMEAFRMRIKKKSPLAGDLVQLVSGHYIFPSNIPIRCIKKVH